MILSKIKEYFRKKLLRIKNNFVAPIRKRKPTVRSINKAWPKGTKPVIYNNEYNYGDKLQIMAMIMIALATMGLMYDLADKKIKSYVENVTINLNEKVGLLENQRVEIKKATDKVLKHVDEIIHQAKLIPYAQRQKAERFRISARKQFKKEMLLYAQKSYKEVLLVYPNDIEAEQKLEEIRNLLKN